METLFEFGSSARVRKIVEASGGAADNLCDHLSLRGLAA
jgi:hypothetical protein